MFEITLVMDGCRRGPIISRENPRGVAQPRGRGSFVFGVLFALIDGRDVLLTPLFNCLGILFGASLANRDIEKVGVQLIARCIVIPLGKVGTLLFSLIRGWCCFF